MCQYHWEFPLQATMLEDQNTRSNHRMFSIKKGVLKNFAKFPGKHRPLTWNFIKKETPTQVFSCGLCENFKGTFL